MNAIPVVIEVYDGVVQKCMSLTNCPKRFLASLHPSCGRLQNVRGNQVTT